MQEITLSNISARLYGNKISKSKGGLMEGNTSKNEKERAKKINNLGTKSAGIFKGKR